MMSIESGAASTSAETTSVDVTGRRSPEYARWQTAAGLSVPRGQYAQWGNLPLLTARTVRQLFELAEVAVKMVSKEVLPHDHDERESAIQQ